MSYSSKVLYTGDGVTDTYNVPFPFISRSHVSVFVNDVLQLVPMNFSWTGSATIQFSSAPGLDDAIEIKRNTSPTSTLVDFVDGSVLRESDLDTAYLHNFYLGQEYADSFNDLIQQTLVRFATAQGIEETEPDQIILDLVADMVGSAAASNLQARISDIDANAEAIITLGEGLQAQVNTLAEGVAAAVFVQPDEPVPGVGGVPNPIPEGARWYDTDDSNAPYIYQSSAWVPISDPRIGVAAADIDYLQVQTDNTNAALLDEMYVRATETTALSQRLNILGATNADGSAFILDLDKVQVGATESLSQRFSQITADWQGADSTLSTQITDEASARASADGAIASTIALIGAENGAQTAFILDSNTVKIDSDAGQTFAQKITALEAADSANSASITTIQTVSLPGIETDVDGLQTDVGTLEAKYGVSLNVNGYVTGFVQNNNGTSGSFVILANKFAVVDPSGDPGETEYVPFEISGGKINMRSDVKIDGNLMVTGTINGSALVNGTIGSTQIGPNAITTTQLNANAVTAVKISANAVTADKINVTNLAAVNADMGNITAGTITLNTSGYIKGGQTTYHSGTGFFLGYSGGAYRFSLGDQTDFITWDGTELKVRGNLSLGSYTWNTTDSILEALTERSHNTLVFTEKKKFKINKPGTLRVVYQTRIGSTSGGVVQSGQVRIKLDGVVKDTNTVATSGYITQSYVITTTETSDYITIELRAAERNTTEPVITATYIKDVKLQGVIDLGEQVITD